MIAAGIEIFALPSCQRVPERTMSWSTASLYVMAGFYFLAGIMHFVKPAIYLKMMPPWIPYHRFMVYASGVVEIVLAVGLVIPACTSKAAWAVIALLIAVFPANVYMLTSRKFRISPVLLWMRLPLQLVLILWAYSHT